MLALWSGTVVAAHAEPVREIEFIEVRDNAVGSARRTLTTYAAALRGGAARADVTLLQEIDRPERFALLESAQEEARGTGMQEAQPALRSLRAFLVAPVDRREHEDLVPPCEPRGTVRGFYVIAHLDIAGREREGVDGALRKLARAVCAAPGHLAFHIWRQSNRGNHFDLVAAWSSRGHWAAFSSGQAARQFRETVGPLLGSPYDERLYRVVD